MQPEIRHIAGFNLKYPKGSAEAQKFLADPRAIPGAILYAAQYVQCEEISPKNG